MLPAKLLQSCRDSLQPQGLLPAGLLYPWNSPGKNTGVGCHFLLQLGIYTMVLILLEINKSSSSTAPQPGDLVKSLSLRICFSNS